jgi:hypothetical protein
MTNSAGSGSDYDDTVTITLDRRVAEDLYYALALALGSNDYSLERVGKSGKNGGKGYPAY